MKRASKVLLEGGTTHRVAMLLGIMLVIGLVGGDRTRLVLGQEQEPLTLKGHTWPVLSVVLASRVEKMCAEIVIALLVNA